MNEKKDDTKKAAKADKRGEWQPDIPQIKKLKEGIEKKETTDNH